MSKRRRGKGGNRDGESREPPHRAEVSGVDLGSARGLLALAVLFAAVSFGVYTPALRGAFLSDDSYYILSNPWIQEISLANIAAILDPSSDHTLTVANYAPVQMLLHMGQWAAFGSDTLGWHIGNIVVHSLVGALFALLLLRTGLPAASAVLGSAFFLFHPANVEVVAWISQIKTLTAMAFMLAALLLHRRHPWLGTAAFALSLFAKATAVVALPFLVVHEFVRARRAARGEADAAAVDRRSLVAWSAVLVGFGAVEFVAFLHANQSAVPISNDVWVRMLSSAAIGARYLAMTSTGFGVSAFHDPAPSTSLFDPWVLAAVAACAVLGARLLFCLFTARQEAAWWVWAAASFVPVSQLFPFVFPMADRYLYFIAPGLVGAALLLGSELWTRLGPAQARAAGRALTVAAALVVAVFAWQSHARSQLWTSESLLIVDGVRHYPEGALAHYGRARQAALRRDWDAAVASLRVATARGHRGLAHLLTDAAFSSQLGRPEMRSFVRELAGRQIEQIRSGGRLTVPSLLRLAQFHMIREEYDQATAVLEEIIVGGGPYERNARDLLAEVTRGAAR